jgi:hypothetical protein
MAPLLEAWEAARKQSSSSGKKKESKDSKDGKSSQDSKQPVKKLSVVKAQWSAFA